MAIGVVLGKAHARPPTPCVVRRRSTTPGRKVVRAATTERSFQVSLEMPHGKAASFACPADEYILDAADANGIDLPYSCRAGACSTCAARLLQGTVDQADQNFLTQEQMDDGLVLLCSAFPTSDCAFLTHQEVFG